MDIDTVVKKVEDFVSWLDNLPSVPAAISTFFVGLCVPKTIVVGVIMLGIVYTIVKFHSKD